MDSSGSELHPVEQLADEFMERQRRGERPTLDEYAQRYPELADEIREVFPALVMIDQIAPGKSDHDQTVARPEQVVQKQFGDYRILREIGHGGMGVVYEAEQESLGRRVALKVLLREMAANDHSRQRFQREARAAARMHHTNIVPVFEVGQEDGIAFYAMQLILGQGLDLVIDDLKRLRREHSSRSGANALPPSTGVAQSIAASLVRGEFQQEDLAAAAAAEFAGKDSRAADQAFSETIDQKVGSTVPAALPGQSEMSTAETNRTRFHRSVAQIGIQTADALAYAHARRIIHRDIKPSNLILDAGGVVWVTDFGLAKTDDEAMTHTGDILGTMRYMSPERFRGQCDVRADVYSLGLTLYELLVLKPAFESPDRLKLVEMVRQSEPLTPRSIDPRIPLDLETIVLKSIDKDPKRRYQSADELSEDLNRFVNDEPIKARRISLPERLVRWSRRNKGVAASLTVIGLLLVAATGLSSIAAAYFQELNLKLQQQLTYSTVARLAAQSQAIREELPVESMLLAIESVETTYRHDGTVIPVAHEALLTTAHNVGGLPLIGDEGRIWKIAISPDGRWLVTESGSEGVPATRRWDLKNPTATALLFDAKNSAAISRDGLWRVSINGDNTARLWDLTAADPTASPLVLRGHQNVVRGVAISQCGRFVVTDSVDGTARLWDLTADDPAASSTVLPGDDNRIVCVAISPDNRWLVTGTWFIRGSGNRAPRLWNLSVADPAASSVLLPGFEDGVKSVAIGPNGRWLVAIGDTTAGLWDLNSEDVPSSATVLQGHSATIVSFELSPDGSRLITVCADATARLWELSANDSSSSIVLRGHEEAVFSAAFSPNGRWLITGSHDATARIWDLAAEDPASSSLVLKGHDETIDSIAISPDNRWVFTGSWDGTVRRWDLASANPASPLSLRSHRERIQSVVTSPNGRWLVTHSQDGHTYVWGLTTAGDDSVALVQELAGHVEAVSSLAISPDSRWLVTGGSNGEVRLRALADLRAKPCVFTGHSGEVLSVAIGPDNRWLVTRDRGQRARLFDLKDAGATPKVLQEYLATGRMSPIAISPDGHWLVTATSAPPPSQQDVAALLWDLTATDPASSPIILQARAPKTAALAFSPDNRWLVTAGSRTVHVWDLESEDPAASRRNLQGHRSSSRIPEIAICPNSKWLATVCYDSTALLWDLKSPNPSASAVLLDAHTGALHSVAISPDGQWLVTGSEDKTARVWDLTAKDPTSSSLVLRGHKGWISSIAFSPDSRWVITGSVDDTVRFWDLSIDSLMERARLLAGRELTVDERERYTIDAL